MQKRKLKRFLTSKSAENYCEKQFALLWGKEECCSDDGKYSFIQGPFVCNGDFNESYHPNGERSMIRVGIDEEPNKKLKYGQSITDACLSWQETQPLLKKLAMAVKQRKNI